MRFLLDTHACVWWLTDHSSLSAAAAEAITAEGNDLVLSPVVPWEIETKIRTRGWPGADVALRTMGSYLIEGSLRPLPIGIDHARLAGSLPSPHRDPFDRMIAAQAILDELTVLTRDPAFRTLGCATLW